MTAPVWLLFFVLSAMWRAGGAMLAAALPNGRVGWLVRTQTGLAVAGALAMLALNWIAWWLVVDDLELLRHGSLLKRCTTTTFVELRPPGERSG